MSKARHLWKDRVARLGSLIQLAFAAFWFIRGALATDWLFRLPIAIILATGVIAFGVWGEKRTRKLVAAPTGFAAKILERQITIATVLQLVASFILPEVVIMLGRPDLIVGSVSVSIGALLLWLYAKLRTSGHLLMGILLVIVPIGLAIFLNGNALTALSGLTVGVMLVISALIGLRSLIDGKGGMSPRITVRHSSS